MHAFLTVVGHHPQAALLFVVLVAFAESLALVGTFVPAAIVMFGAGALIGNGTLNAWETLGAAVIGAVTGDGLSYEMGRRCESRIREWPMFKRHPEAVARSATFIQRHGGKSVVFARFAGAVRAFVPLLAGFAQMSRARFYATNVGSALLWAPVHILPGVLFGTSLALAEAVSGRLAAMLLLLVLVLWMMTWLVRTVVRISLPAIRRSRETVVMRARGRTSIVARATLALFDPERPGSTALLFGSMVVIGAGWLFLGVLEDVISRDPLVQADMSVYQYLQDVRTQPMDWLMVMVTEMGSIGVMLPLVIVVLAWLAWRRSWTTAAYWLGVASFGELLVMLLKYTLGRHRPITTMYAGLEQFSFPSGHVTVSTVLMAFLAFLLSRGQTRSLRAVIALATGAYIAMVAFSRLYLGAHWLSDVLGGMSLGLVWVGFVATGYSQRVIRDDIAPRVLMLVVVATLVTFGALWIRVSAPEDLARYAIPSQVRLISDDDWINGDWQQLPARRLELAGDSEEPFQLQWACSVTGLGSVLKAAGWQEAPAWTLKSALGSLAPQAKVQDLPVLPRFNQGDRAEVVYVRSSSGQLGKRDVLRLWRSRFQSISAGTAKRPIWYGAVYREDPHGAGILNQHQSVAQVAALLELIPSTDQKVIRNRDNVRNQTVIVRCTGG
jgi:membrane protein DedA with SNARE-associated domain/membrane-associated phospholipid phosphatase